MGGLAVLGLGAGISPLFSSYYNTGVWLVLGLVLTLAAAVAAVALSPRVTTPAALAFAGVAGLGLWSLASTAWAHGAESATVDANRWLAYAALLLLMLVLVRSRRHVVVLLGAVGIGMAVVAASVLLRMLGSDPGTLFLGGRLNAPLGYINGEGCAFALACWFSLALAERREAPLAAVGAAASVGFACLTLMSQSRGAAISLFVAVLVALAVIPGARRRILALAIVAGGVALAAGTLVKVYTAGQAGTLSPSVGHHAAVAIILAAAAVGVLWGAGVVLTAALERGRPAAAITLQRTASVLAALVIAAPLAVAVVRSSTIERTLRTQWNAFVHLSDTGSASPLATQTRLFSGAGNRYDYWRIAWHTFTAHPVAGVGAGNYAAAYYRNRRTTESIENPHSLELQTLAELGVVGALLLLVALGGVVLGARRLRRAARGSPAARTAMVAATGASVVWLVDTSGDWMHLLPGVSAVALAAATVLCRPGVFEPAALTAPTSSREAAASAPTASREAVAPTPERTPRVRIGPLAGAAAAAFVLAVSGASLLRSGLVRHYLDQAHAELASDSAGAIANANRALRLDGSSLDAYELKAAGQARFDLAGAARSTLLAAVKEDPDDFVTWTLLGDLEVRLHDFSAAGTYYGRAHQLDPNDPTIAALAAHPAGALAGTAQG
jgi:tetratricopeptide (TPR) repeat protein